MSVIEKKSKVKKLKRKLLEKNVINIPCIFLKDRGKQSVLSSHNGSIYSLSSLCMENLLHDVLLPNFNSKCNWCDFQCKDKLTAVVVFVLKGIDLSELAKYENEPNKLKCNYNKNTEEPPLKLLKKDMEFNTLSTTYNCQSFINEVMPKSAPLFSYHLEVGASLSPNAVNGLLERLHPTTCPVEIEVSDNVEPKTETKKLEAPLNHRDTFDRRELLLSPSEMENNKFPLPFGEDHAVKYFKFKKLHESYSEVTSASPMFAIDCEMCMTSRGSELTRISVVDEKLNVIYSSFVKPSKKIKEYLTQFSGITKQDLEGVTTRLLDVQQELRKLLPRDAILVGQSLANDLTALKLMHPYVIDTAVILNLTGLRNRHSSLKSLTKLFLGVNIQNRDLSEGHHPTEDASAAILLVLYKLKHDKSFGDVVKCGSLSFTPKEIEDSRNTNNSKWKASSRPETTAQTNLFQTGRFVSNWHEAFAGMPLMDASALNTQSLGAAVDIAVGAVNKSRFVVCAWDTKIAEPDTDASNRKKQIQRLDLQLKRLIQNLPPSCLVLVQFAGEQSEEILPTEFCSNVALITITG